MPPAQVSSLDNIEPSSVVLTVAWRGYNGVTKHGYTRVTTNLSDSGDPAQVVMAGVHRIASLLKRWLLAPTKALPLVSILITISTNTRLGLTVAPLTPAGSFSTA